MDQYGIPVFKMTFNLSEIALHRVNRRKGQHQYRSMYWLKCCIVWISIVGCSSAADIGYDPIACGALGNNTWGKPIDYRSAPADQRNLVERAHFRAEHALIQRGATRFPHDRGGASLMGGFDYTLRTFPNHTLALHDIDRLGFILKTEKPDPAKAPYPIECYFKRAVYFVPEDGGVRLVYGLYLTRRGRTKEAIEHLKLAQEYAPDDSNVHYNLGLAYYYSKDYDSAKEHAKRAYELGFPLPGLKNMLLKVGKWN